MSSRTYAPSPSTFAEVPDRYREKGLHPLIIGDTVKDGRYRIIHKLGSGSFATVWLVRDTVAKKYVSLKILSAATSVESKELHILQRITKSRITHKGRDFVIQLLDNFFIDGPNGIHLCLVTAVAGERLARKPDLPYNDLDWPRTIGLQMAQALGFLHVLGVAHAGE
jgi:serine/threonine protein kinase